MKSYFLVVLSVFTIVFASCNKDGDQDTQRVVAHDSTLLKEVLRMDTTRVSGQDTLVKYLFRYDALDRLEKIILPGYGLNPTPNFISEYSFLYAGNDTLPKAFINKYWADASLYNSTPAIYADTLYLFYNGGIIIRDSSCPHTSYNTATITTFTEISGGYKVQRKEVFRNGAYYGSTTTNNVSVVKQGGNIIELRDTISFFSGPLTRKMNFSFDNKVNPYRRAALKYPFPTTFEFDGYTPSYLSYFLSNVNQNNIIYQIRYYPPIAPVSFSFGFDYRANGLPFVRRTLGVRDYNEFYNY